MRPKLGGRRSRLCLAAGAVACLLAVGVGAARAYNEWRARSDIDEAKKAMVARSFDRARALLADALRRRPRDEDSIILLGAFEQSQGNEAAAEAAWSRVASDSPRAADLAMLRARIALGRHRFAAAEPLLLVALGGKGKLAVEARETLVNIYKIQGRFVEARALVSAAWGSYPDPVGLLKELENLGSNNPMSVVTANAALEKAARTAPDDDRVWLGQANLATRTGRFDDARKWLDACLARRGDDPAVWRARFDRALAIQDADEVERALRHLPDEAVAPFEVLTLQAWFASLAGDREEERRAYEGILQREPGNLLAMARLADLYLAAGEAGKAATLRGRRAELNRDLYDYQSLLQKNDPASIRQSARLAGRLGRTFEAHSLWSVIARKEPGDAEARDAMGRLRKEDAGRPRGPLLSDFLARLRRRRPGTRGPAPAGTIGATPVFADDAREAGLVFAFDNGANPLHHMPETMSGGVGLLDYDGDGWMDVYVTQGGPFPQDPAAPTTTGDRLFRNRRDGRFEDATRSTGLAAFARGYGHGVTVGDYDNDGHPDLFITRWRRYALYRNRGDGTFEDATEKAGLGGPRDWPTSAAFADLDGDGDLDLYVCHYLAWDADQPNPCWDDRKHRYSYCSPQYFAPLTDHLFRNDRGRFVDVTVEAGIVDRDGRGMGVVAADLDDDGRLDLYVTNDQTANFLFHNKSGMKFEDVAQSSAAASNGEGTYQASMGLTCGDADGDGLPDLAVTNFFNEYTTLYLNRGGGVFADASDEAGLAVATRHRLGFGLSFLDVDNDGHLDLASANGHVDDFRPEVPFQMPSQLLMGTGKGRFVDATEAAGAPWTVPRVARSLAVGDLDNDGRVDLVIVSHDTPLAYYHNRTPGGHWLTLGLEGEGCRDAIGARVVVTSGGRRLTSWRIGGGSYQSSSDPRLHFGLGPVDRVDLVEVTWPSGRVDRHGPLAADRGYRLREGRGEAEALAGFEARSPQRP
ncbi:FG-GAP-like repeat-containing protein [Aquisphaera insulae]|uniref:FG-GAP-like repeat-containing protein n=1 Tax=Aquisphaera insulae TaxID=2712864 RepID=UPI0013ED8E9F|nr:FG-GAP-like repeat-containing protein [Aquisphaera insulae]